MKSFPVQINKPLDQQKVFLLPDETPTFLLFIDFPLSPNPSLTVLSGLAGLFSVRKRRNSFGGSWPINVFTA